MRYFVRLTLLFAVIAAVCGLGLAGCGKSQAERNPDKVPPKPTGMEPSSAASVPLTPHSNQNPPPNTVPAR